MTGTPAGTSFSATVTKAGEDAVAATYEADASVDATNFDDKKADLFTEASGTYTPVASGDTFDAGTTYYVIKTPAKAAVEGEITITFTMPGEAVKITGITVTT